MVGPTWRGAAGAVFWRMLEADWRGTVALGADGLSVVAVVAAGAGCLGAGPLVGADD